MRLHKTTAILLAATALTACNDNDSNPSSPSVDEQLSTLIDQTAPNGGGKTDFTLPDSDDYANIPADPNNDITAEKVALGQMLYHETAIATAGNSDREGTWSCASCHHVAAGFKAGIPQGIAEGGEGFGVHGEERRMATGFDAQANDPAFVPDTQPVTSPSVLNTAYQEVMLWNGQFGNVEGGIVNSGLSDNVLAPAGTPKVENARGFAGLEIQAIAGMGVHRLSVTNNDVLTTNADYQWLFDAAYPDGSTDVLEDSALAIAAYERTLLSNDAPFQQWLKGDTEAMSEAEKRGAVVFFGDGGCVACHTGPALSSPLNATEDEMFFAIGFADFDSNDPQVTGVVDNATSRGRGGFTGEAADDLKFKVPQLYNLADTTIFGHGASFRSIEDVVKHKNAGVPQKPIPASQLDSRFAPLGLSDAQLQDLTTFLTTGLYDDDLLRYVPTALPSGQCFPVNDDTARNDLGC